MSAYTCSSVDKQQFAHPECNGSLDEWHCNICTPPRKRKGKIKYMSLKEAQHHEGFSSQHAKTVTETERKKWTLNEADPKAWDAPLRNVPVLTKEEMKMRESRLHVDLVRDMVPFWIRGLEAARRGEVLRLEQFLEELESSSSASSWGGGNEWEEGGGWGMYQGDNGYKFVEDVARQEAADEERKQRMHRFFEMPTDEKVRKIDETIRALVAA